MTGFSEGPFVPGGPSRKRFRLKRFAEIKLSTNPNYLIKGILPRVGLAVIWGPPKCGKSFWTFDAAMHIALDWPYRGPCSRARSCIAHSKAAPALRARSRRGDSDTSATTATMMGQSPP